MMLVLAFSDWLSLVPRQTVNVPTKKDQNNNVTSCTRVSDKILTGLL